MAFVITSIVTPACIVLLATGNILNSLSIKKLRKKNDTEHKEMLVSYNGIVKVVNVTTLILQTLLKAARKEKQAETGEEGIGIRSDERANVECVKNK